MKSKGLTVSLWMILFGLGIFAIQKAKASTHRTGKGCYDLRLLGGMVDSNACKETSLQVITRDCQSNAQLKSERAIAKLGKCSLNKVEGVVQLSGDQVPFLAFRSTQFGMETWAVSKSGVAPTTPNQKPIIKSGMAVPTSVSATGEDPSDENSLKKNHKLRPLGLSFYTDLYYAYNINQPTWETKQNLGEQDNGLRISDSHHGHFTMGQVSVGLKRKSKNHRFLIDLAWGPTYERQLVDPLGNRADQVSPIRQAHYSYVLSSRLKSYMRFGKFKSPLWTPHFKPGRNDMYSYSLVETLALPHSHTGVLWQRKWASRWLTKLFIVNGWNVEEDNNASMSHGLTLDSEWGKSTDLHLGAYSGAESPAHPGSVRTLLEGGLRTKWSSSLGFRFTGVYGMADKEPAVNAEGLSWYGASLETVYAWNKRTEIAMRIEKLFNDKGFLSSGKAQEDVMSWAGSVKRKWNRYQNVFAELRYDTGSDNLFYQDADRLTSTQMTVLLATSFAIDRF